VSARIVYSARYRVDIGPHVFPTRKYDLVYDALGRPSAIDPPPATWEDLSLVHTPEYLEKLRTGTMSEEDVAQLELPWSPEMVDGFRVMVGGTIQAALFACALNDRGAETSQSIESKEFPPQSTIARFNVGCHIGGGLHHAFPNHGEGFCPFNDVAVAARVLQRRGIDRVAIVDLDVHHGNGTALVFESDPQVFTFSMHQQHNYPMWKPRGSLDVGLPDGADDATYLRELERALPKVVAHRPQCVFYLAGADPYEDDQLGGLRLTKEGLRRRDRLVIDTFRIAAVPIVVTLAGGYARRVEDTVAIHVATIEEAMDAAAASGRPTAPLRVDRDRRASSGEG
jgi:acetoin utilization deacetylase AcuC-like enzyme